jgi:hypothetical protein
LLIRPNRAFPPVEFWRGTNPSQAANCRPEAKTPASGTAAAIALAMMGQKGVRMNIDRWCAHS